MSDPLTIVKDTSGIDPRFVVKKAAKRGCVSKPLRQNVCDTIDKFRSAGGLDKFDLEYIKKHIDDILINTI